MIGIVYIENLAPLTAVFLETRSVRVGGARHLCLLSFSLSKLAHNLMFTLA